MRHRLGEAPSRRWLARALASGLIATAICTAAPAVASALPASFATEGSGAGQISEPRGIAVEQESGDVYVADSENNRIDKFGPEGEFLLAWGWGVADGKTEALQVCTATCFKGFAGFGAGQLNGAEGIAVDNDPLSSSVGDVYVADTRNARVQKFSPQGELLLMLGGEVDKTTKADICTEEDIEGGDECGEGVPGEGPGAFQGLTKHAVAVDPGTGTLYVGDVIAAEAGRVQRFSEAGAQLGEVGFPGAGESQNLAVDSTKDIYLKSSNLEGVRKYDPSASELVPPRDQGGDGENLAITVGQADELFVNHHQGEEHHVFTFDAAGKQSASFDAGGEAKDGYRGIAYSEHAKALYVLNAAAIRIVTPPPPGPLILAGGESASAIEPTTATLEASINPEGPKATEYHFEYDTTPYAEGEAPHGTSTEAVELKGGESEFEDQPASAPITGLQPATTYHFRVVATNGTQTTVGPDQSFTTLPPVSIESTSVAEVNDQSALLEAVLNPHGVASSYHFEYDTTPYVEGEAPHGTSVPIPDASIGAGSEPVSVSGPIQGLSPSTVYHYRVVAHNALGTSEGPDHAFKTQGLSESLPDGRSYELVSPANKHGAPLQAITEEGGLIQAAPGGGAFAYVAIGPLGPESKGVRSPEDSQLLSKRDPAKGWSTQDITTPHEEIALIDVGFPSEYQFFAEDLSAGVVQPKTKTLLDPENPANTEQTPYRRDANGAFAPLVNARNVPANTKFGGSVEFETASPDLSHVVLSSAQVLAGGFEAGFVPEGTPNLYELSGGALTLASVLPDGRPAAEEGLSVAVGNQSRSMRGAISSDGDRLFFNDGGELLMRDVSLARTLQLDQAQPGASGESGGGIFQAASADGSRVFFTDTARLTTDATANPNEPDLYMCEIGKSGGGQLLCALSDLSVDERAGEAANVQGQVSAIDANGSHVYFAASGVLTSVPNARGEVAVAGDLNMYEYDTETRQIELVAPLASGDAPDVSEELIKLTARSSPNGRYLAFMSERSLTGYDNRDANSGALDEEVFLFDSSSDAVRCVSCDPSGARPKGVLVPSRFPGLLVDRRRIWEEKWLAGSIPGWTAQSLQRSFYQSRYVSDSGRTFFNAADPLVPQDTNKVEDVYQYEPPGVGTCSSSSASFSSSSGGCVNLISSGTSKEESAFLDASENGDEAFFLTASRLTSNDVDGAFDVYDAHVCSDTSPCPTPPSAIPGCEGDSCQNPVSPSSDLTPSSLTYKGPGNAAPPTPPPIAKAKPPTKAQLLKAALKACKKKKQKAKRLSCERQARKRYGAKASKAKSRAKAKKASHKRGRGRS